MNFAVVSPARLRWLVLFLLGLAPLGTEAAPDRPSTRDWATAVLEAQAELAKDPGNPRRVESIAEALSVRLELEFPRQWDWCLQDRGADFSPWIEPARLAEAVPAAVRRMAPELGEPGQRLLRRTEALVRAGARTEPRRWLELYEQACERRRQVRLESLVRRFPRWIFTKHHTLGGSHYAYTEGQSDAQHERQFEPGAALCLLEFARGEARVRELVRAPDGVIRDPDVSWDGRRVLFAWKKGDRNDDYHLYEWDPQADTIRPLTDGLGFADYEGVYLPNGHLLFNSTRCVQTVDCWWTEVSNLYTCDPDGGALRRLTFDQVHDNYPTVLPDGRVVYTRWEYNDRGQIYVQGLFQMNPDGTSQTEYYGNNSWFPTALLHARGVPGTEKVVAIFAGHHTRQTGKLGIIDPARGRQENRGAQLIAPVRPTPAVRVDAYGQDGELFQYPYPLSETEFVVALAPLGWERSPTLFKLYWVDAAGRRELLVADAAVSCNQPVPLAARPLPPLPPSRVDYAQSAGTCYVQDVYHGPGLDGIPRGTVKRLRVVALEYRAAGIGWNYNHGPAGDALASTPVAIGNGSWDVKIVLGDATVHADGSALFRVPARRPFYLQAIDEAGCAVQTMRSWTVLQPGENASCAGCHEPKNSAPLAGARLTRALEAPPEDLVPFPAIGVGPRVGEPQDKRAQTEGAADAGAADDQAGETRKTPLDPPRGFSFAREIQPILDRHCVRCHHDPALWEERLGWQGDALTAKPPPPENASGKRAFSLLPAPVPESLSKRVWTASYLALVHAGEAGLEGNAYLAGRTNEWVNWIGAQSVPEMLPPYAAGAARSRLLTWLKDGHHDVTLTTAERDRLACWIDLQVPFCGDYEEAANWTEEEAQKYRRYLDKRRCAAALEAR